MPMKKRENKRKCNSILLHRLHERFFAGAEFLSIMRRVVLLASLLVMSSCLAGCTDEARQNEEKNADDTRSQISAKVSFVDVFINSNTEGSSDNNSSSEVKVDSIQVIARTSSGSSNITVSEVSHYITCGVSELTLVTETLTNSTPSELDDAPLTGESVLIAGQTFQFTVQLQDCAAAVGDSLLFRVIVEGGGETLADLEFDSTTVGKSVV